MTQNRIIITLLIVLAVTISYAIELDNELFNFSLATFMLAYELYTFRNFQQAHKSNKIFKLNSQEWLGGIGASAFVIYHFSNEQMNSWNIVAIVFMIIFGILYAIRNRTTTYQEELGT